MLLDFLRGNSTKSDVAVEANLNDAPSVQKFTIPEPDVSEMLLDQEVPFEEMIHDEENGVWLFDCPCGDQFVLAEVILSSCCIVLASFKSRIKVATRFSKVR